MRSIFCCNTGGSLPHTHAQAVRKISSKGEREELLQMSLNMVPFFIHTILLHNYGKWIHIYQIMHSGKKKAG